MKLILEVNTECADSVQDAHLLIGYLAGKFNSHTAEKVVEKKQPAATAEKPSSNTADSGTAKSATQPKASNPEKKPVATAAVESAPSTTTAGDAPTIEELTKVVQALTLSGNRAKLLEILKEYNAPKASTIPAELQREFINKCQAVLDV